MLKYIQVVEVCHVTVADLQPFRGFPFLDVALTATGWLGASSRWLDVDVSEAFFERLVELSTDPWQPGGMMAMGSHSCELCRFVSESGSLRYKDREVRAGNRNLFIPGDGLVYVAPTTLAHYVAAHGYGPPLSFQQAVLACPPMRSVPYFQALKKSGWRSFQVKLDAGHVNLPSVQD